MQNESDTESEPEDARAGCSDSFGTTELSPLGITSEGRNEKHTEVRVAMDRIKWIDISTVQQDTGIHNDILIASNTIINFLDDTRSPLIGRCPGKTLAVFCELLHIPFLSILFDHRKVFHGIAAQALMPRTAASTIVCWVDVILAKLGDAAVAVAGGFSREPVEQPVFENLRMQREDDGLRAAAQLPHQWQSVAGVIASDHASPAAKRLALRLMFAVYIIGPQFNDYNPWREIGVRPQEMMNLLHRCVSQMSLDGFPGRETVVQPHDQERVRYSMIVSLFAATELMQRSSNEVQVQSPLRPYSLAALLNLIQLVMHPNETVSTLQLVSPRVDLDLAQTIIVRWAETVPWSWATWDDQRIANAESITFLTATWLYHINTPFFGTTPDDSQVLASDFTPRLAKDSAAASAAILQILHHTVLSLCTPSRLESLPLPSLDVLAKSCRATVQLLQVDVNGRDHRVERRIPDLCKCLCSLFILLGENDGELKIKDSIVEALTLVDPETFRSCLKQIQEDAKIRLVVRLDEAIVRCKRNLVSDAGRCSVEENKLLAVKVVLNFLTIIWHNRMRGCVHRQTISPFIASLVDLLSHEPPDSMSSIILRDCLLTSLSAIESDPAIDTLNNFMQHEAPWKLAMETACSNLVVASGFAHYILAADRVCDSLLCAEAWDFLRDVLLLVFARHFVEDDEPLALVICPIICRALIQLIQMDTQAVSAQFMLSSPWTMNLCTNLQDLLEGGSSQPTEYFSVLKSRLGVVGKALLDQVTSFNRES